MKAKSDFLLLLDQPVLFNSALSGVTLNHYSNYRKYNNPLLHKYSFNLYMKEITASRIKRVNGDVYDLSNGGYNQGSSLQGKTISSVNSKHLRELVKAKQNNDVFTVKKKSSQKGTMKYVYMSLFSLKKQAKSCIVTSRRQLEQEQERPPKQTAEPQVLLGVFHSRVHLSSPGGKH